MKLKILSDLHIEICDYIDHISKEPTILVLAGDISYFSTETIYTEFLNDLSLSYDYILCISGNHEYYYSTIDHDTSGFEKRLNSNVKFIDNKTFIYEKYKFIGTPLWTNFGENNFSAKLTAKKNMTDFHIIFENENNRQLRPDTIYDKFIKNFDFIKSEIDPNYKNIIITHHAPSIKSISQRYLTESNKYLNYAYYSDLEKFIFDNENSIKYWIHGHTHDSSDYMIGNVRIVANPRGYAKNVNGKYILENKNFNYDLLLDLD